MGESKKDVVMVTPKKEVFLMMNGDSLARCSGGFRVSSALPQAICLSILALLFYHLPVFIDTFFSKLILESEILKYKKKKNTLKLE